MPEESGDNESLSSGSDEDVEKAVSALIDSRTSKVQPNQTVVSETTPKSETAVAPKGDDDRVEANSSDGLRPARISFTSPFNRPARTSANRPARISANRPARVSGANFKNRPPRMSGANNFGLGEALEKARPTSASEFDEDFPPPKSEDGKPTSDEGSEGAKPKRASGGSFRAQKSEEFNKAFPPLMKKKSSRRLSEDTNAPRRRRTLDKLVSTGKSMRRAKSQGIGFGRRGSKVEPDGGKDDPFGEWHLSPFGDIGAFVASQRARSWSLSYNVTHRVTKLVQQARAAERKHSSRLVPNHTELRPTLALLLPDDASENLKAGQAPLELDHGEKKLEGAADGTTQDATASGEEETAVSADEQDVEVAPLWLEVFVLAMLNLEEACYIHPESNFKKSWCVIMEYIPLAVHPLDDLVPLHRQGCGHYFVSPLCRCSGAIHNLLC